MNQVTLGANLTTMSDDVPLQLPRYVFRRANGSFRYKRNVPERLRPLIGKATLYRQLGDSYREAMQALPLVHARIEALLNDEADKSARERSLEIIRGALGDEVAEMVLAETVPEYSPIEDALNELGKDLHKQKMPTEVVQQVYTGKLKPDVLTLAMTLDQYEAYKSDTPKAAREIGQRVERLRTDMKSVFGKQRLKYTPLTDITRQDANDLRDHLLSRVSANSAVRMLGVVRTAINHVIVEHSLTIPNVFTNLKIKGAGATKHDRLPLSDDQVVTLETAFSRDDTAWALYVTLRDTGARVSEVSGLSGKLETFNRLQIHCDAPLVAVVGSEIAGARSGQAAGFVATRSRFNFDHISTEVGEDKSAGRTHHHVAKFDHPDTIEWAGRTGHVALLLPA